MIVVFSSIHDNTVGLETKCCLNAVNAQSKLETEIKVNQTLILLTGLF
jgi:hypothetical protein